MEKKQKLFKSQNLVEVKNEIDTFIIVYRKNSRFKTLYIRAKRLWFFIRIVQGVVEFFLFLETNEALVYILTRPSCQSFFESAAFELLNGNYKLAMFVYVTILPCTCTPIFVVYGLSRFLVAKLLFLIFIQLAEYKPNKAQPSQEEIENRKLEDLHKVWKKIHAQQKKFLKKQQKENSLCSKINPIYLKHVAKHPDF